MSHFTLNRTSAFLVLFVSRMVLSLTRYTRGNHETRRRKATQRKNKKKLARGKFAWQEGYGAFSYGHSQLDTIVRYIENQEKHHRRRSFRAEYLTFLRKFEIDFKEEYVFEFYA